jgi:hypothetical protein
MNRHYTHTTHFTVAMNLIYPALQWPCGIIAMGGFDVSGP